MSLLVDPQYFRHNLKLNYLRRLPDPIGPSAISFPTTTTTTTNEQQPNNPYIQLSGLADPQRWPELLVRGSPPETLTTSTNNNNNNNNEIRTRRRRNNNNNNNSLRYSETIVGPKGSALGAGMRVSARRQPPSKLSNSTTTTTTTTTEPPPQNPAAGALALTEGRTTLTPGGGLNPEDSDDEPVPQAETSRRPISRNPTNTTIKTHRRRISAITFASNPLSFASPPGSILNLSRSRTRAQRGLSISSIATTNTVISSDLSEHHHHHHHQAHNNSPTPSSLHLNPENTRPDPTTDHHHHQEPPSPFTQPPPAEPESIYYSTEHDPDKRMSDMLFTYRPFDAKRSTQIVGRVELEPAPLLEADNEDDSDDEEDIETDHTDTGTEHGEDDSSFNPEELIAEDSIDDSLSTKSRKRPALDLTTPADENKTTRPSSHPDLLISLDRSNNSSSQSPPMVRRRERRRVNIKMGKLVGPPIIEEDSANPESVPSKPILTAGLRFQRAASAVARPSLPDLRQAHHPTQQQAVAGPPQETNTRPLSSFSPGRARALTTPTPIPSIEVNPTVSKLKEDQTAGPGEPSSSSTQRTFPRNRSGSGPIGISRIRRSLLQANPTRPQSGSTPTPPPPPPPTKVTEQPKPPLTVPKRSRKPKRDQLSFKKIELEDPKLKKPVVQKSILTQLLTAQSASSSGDNPFRCFYALLASKERNALKISLYYPFSTEPSKPIKTSMKADVCVEEVVGFALWKYVEEAREPKLAEISARPDGLDLLETFAWCLRLVEDDGEVDDDFPALDRTRPAAKVGSNEFAIVMATEAQAKQNESAQTQIQRRPSRVLGEPKRVPKGLVEPSGSVNTGAASLLPPPISAMMGNSSGTTIFDGGRGLGGGVSGSLISGGYSSTALGGGSLTGTTVYLKVRIPSPGKGVDSINTTLNVTMDMYLADVLESLVKKKSLGAVKDWALLVPSSPSIPAHQRDIVVPLDRTVQSLQGVSSLALVKRAQISSKLLRNTQLNGNTAAQNTNPSASIFKRLSEIPQPKYVSITDLTSSSKSFLIQTKRRGILGKSDRLLTIEDDYVHIAPNHQSLTTTATTNHLNLLSANNDNSLAGTSSGKVSSYHISQIVDCIHRPQAGFKLVVLRDSGEKRYDVEAENPQSAMEIVRHIKGLK
ncbi:hypothetical protein PTTG_10081, partial [Puccinia triticina 1-1 BBBD Race 1]